MAPAVCVAPAVGGVPPFGGGREVGEGLLEAQVRGRRRGHLGLGGGGGEVEQPAEGPQGLALGNKHKQAELIHTFTRHRVRRANGEALLMAVKVCRYGN